MKYSFRSQHIEVTELDRQQMDNKLDRLKKHLSPPFVIDVNCIREHLRSAGEMVKCSITIEQGKKVFHADRTASSMQSALDEVIAALQKELAKKHDKRKDHS